MNKLIIAVILLSAVAFGQTKPATLTEAQQIKVLKVQKTLADLQKQESDIQAQWAQFQNQARQLQETAADLEKKLTVAKQAVQTEQDAAIKAVGLDPAKYELSPDLVPVAKAAPQEKK